MKFWAKVNLEGHDREDAAYLLIRFFEEFNPESSICFKGNEAIMEIFFDEPPQGIIKALSYFCDGKLDFCYGRKLEDYENGSSFSGGKLNEEAKGTEQSEKEDVKQSMQEATENSAEHTLENPESTEDGESESTTEITKENQKEGSDEQSNSETKGTVKARRHRSLANAEKPDLSEFAKKATSYQEFYENIAKWIDMEKKHTFFIQLILAAGEVEEIAWKNIDEILTTRGVTYKSYDKIWTGQRINEKFRELGNSVTTLPLLYEIVRYKNFDFQNQSEEVPAKAIPEEILEDVEVVSEEVTEAAENVPEMSKEQEDSTPKTRVRMKCMMGENIAFEEALGNVDQTKPIEERVKYVLTAMGWSDDKNNKAHQQIFKIANAAVRLRKMEFDVIYSRADIPEYEQAEARMQFSKFINNFLIREPYHGFKVHVSEFLRELQSIIMLESEF